MLRIICRIEWTSVIFSQEVVEQSNLLGSYVFQLSSCYSIYQGPYKADFGFRWLQFPSKKRNQLTEENNLPAGFMVMSPITLFQQKIYE